MTDMAPSDPPAEAAAPSLSRSTKPPSAAERPVVGARILDETEASAEAVWGIEVHAEVSPQEISERSAESASGVYLVMVFRGMVGDGEVLFPTPLSFSPSSLARCLSQKDDPVRVLQWLACIDDAESIETILRLKYVRSIASFCYCCIFGVT